METKNDILAILTSGILVLLFVMAVLLYKNYRLSKKVEEFSQKPTKKM